MRTSPVTRSALRGTTTAVVSAAVVLGLAVPAHADDASKEPSVPGFAAPAPELNGAQLSGNLQAAPSAALNAAMVRSLGRTAGSSKYLGSRFSGLVMDPASGRVLWRYNTATTRMPASTQKLATAYTVLHSMSASTRFVTKVYRPKDRPNVIYLKGAGDPTLSLARLKALAGRVAVQMKANGQSTAAIYLDSSAMPRPVLATGWKASYLKSDVQYVRGLGLLGYRGSDASMAAGKAFSAYLTAAGIKSGLQNWGTTPYGSTQVGQSTSTTVGSMVATMLSVSQNDYAEYLLRHAAKARGYSATFTGSIANQRALLSAAGVSLAGYRAYDGSGLSRSNRMPATTLAGIVRALWNNPADQRIAFAWGAMPRGGQTGTLYSRFKTGVNACAKGKVLAKTGTLSDAVSLAGIATSVDGAPRVFVLQESGQRSSKAIRDAVDTLATTVVGCRIP